MIKPSATAWFQSVDGNGKLVELKDSKWYLSNQLGFKEMVEGKRVVFKSVDGRHMEFGKKEFRNVCDDVILNYSADGDADFTADFTADGGDGDSLLKFQ
jgi:Palmitoyl protein thioesterase